MRKFLVGVAAAVAAAFLLPALLVRDAPLAAVAGAPDGAELVGGAADFGGSASDGSESASRSADEGFDADSAADEPLDGAARAESSADDGDEMGIAVGASSARLSGGDGASGGDGGGSSASSSSVASARLVGGASDLSGDDGSDLSGGLSAGDDAALSVGTIGDGAAGEIGEYAGEFVGEIAVLRGGAVETMALEDYVAGVVAAEMDGSFPPEARRAQAIAARSLALYRVAHPKHGEAAVCLSAGCCAAWREPDGGAVEAAKATAGLIATYGGEPIMAAFFSTSAGATESAADVWGAAIPYLVSVESAGEESPYARSTVRFSLDELERELGAGGEWSLKRSAAGGVKRAMVGGAVFSGEAVRLRLGLNSTNFDVKIDGGEAVFDVRGCGHGVGLSQYGAAALAARGADACAIVRHYYSGVEVERMVG